MCELTVKEQLLLFGFNEKIAGVLLSGEVFATLPEYDGAPCRKWRLSDDAVLEQVYPDSPDNRKWSNWFIAMDINTEFQTEADCQQHLRNIAGMRELEKGRWEVLLVDDNEFFGLIDKDLKDSCSDKGQ